MTIRKLSASVLVSLVVLASLMFNASPVFAETYQNVHVLVAYDEELEHTAKWSYGYSAETFCWLFVDTVSDRFETAFNIKFTIIRYVFWDSNDSITDDSEDLLFECINETGFYSGMTYNLIPIDVLIVFSDQETTDKVGGRAELKLGAVLVFEWYYWLTSSQLTDNVLQHELTHLYVNWFADDPHHEIEPPQEGYDCVMNMYGIYYHPLDITRHPYGGTTENWCDVCRDRIMEMKGKWGREQTVGGGPYYPIPYSKGEVKLEP